MYQAFIKVVLLGIAAVIFTSCDKDFNEIGSGIVGDDHYGLETKFDVSLATRTVGTGAVESRNLPINPLGIYKNPAFGTTIANFATQVELASVNPTFDPLLHPAVTKVVLYIPYFSKVTESNSDTGNTYELDSIYGAENGRFELSVFRSGYFLQDIDFTNQEQQAQRYYTDQNAEFFNAKIGTKLNDGDIDQNSAFQFKSAEIVTTTTTDGETTTTRTAPGMKLTLNSEVFQEAILEAPAGTLQNNNAFKNYFRGLYFMCENHGDEESALALLNFKGGKITVTYEVDKTTTDATRVEKSLVLNLTGNSVSLQTIIPTSPYQSALSQNSDMNPRLWIKGGEGSVAIIDLFGTTDLIGYADDDNSIDNDPDDGNIYDGALINVPNGIPDELDEIRHQNWLINEANLTFNIDQTSLTDSENSLRKAAEPRRIYLYDVNNRRQIVDYTYDGTKASNAKNAKYVFGGLLEAETSGTKRGIRYKIRLTNYINNLIKNDSTNVTLGLSVTEDINITTVAKLKTITPANEILNQYVPTASVMSPLGTVLYGNSMDTSLVPDDKRLKLEIYYTKPD